MVRSLAEESADSAAACTGLKGSSQSALAGGALGMHCAIPLRSLTVARHRSERHRMRSGSPARVTRAKNSSGRSSPSRPIFIRHSARGFVTSAVSACFCGAALLSYAGIAILRRLGRATSVWVGRCILANTGARPTEYHRQRHITRAQAEPGRFAAPYLCLADELAAPTTIVFSDHSPSPGIGICIVKRVLRISHLELRPAATHFALPVLRDPPLVAWLYIQPALLLSAPSHAQHQTSPTVASGTGGLLVFDFVHMFPEYCRRL